jgi:4-hydroxybenzoate polyprenyltransferase
MESYQQVRLPTPSLDISEVKQLVSQKSRNVLHLLLFSSTYVGCAGAGIAYLSSLLQGIPPNPACVLIPFLVIFSVYNLNRGTDETEDAINHQERFAFTKSHERHLTMAALVGYAGALLLSSLHGTAAFLVTMIPLVAGVLYSVPIFPAFLPFRRLKEIPLGKNITVSLSWALTLTLLPSTLSGVPLGFGTGVSFFFFLNWAIVASILPDIRDREGDAIAGICTLPVLLGEHRTLRLLTGWNLIMGVGVIYAAGSLLSRFWIVLMAGSIVYTAACIWAFLSPDHRDLLCDLFSDGQFLLIAMVVAVLLPIIGVGGT